MRRGPVFLVVALALLAGCPRKQGAAGDAGTPSARKAAAPDAAPRVPATVEVQDIKVSVRAWPKEAGEAPPGDELVPLVKKAIYEGHVFKSPGYQPRPGEQVLTGTLVVECGLDVAPAKGKKRPRLGAVVISKMDWAKGVSDEEAPDVSSNALTEKTLEHGTGHRLAGLAREHLERSLTDTMHQLVAKERVRTGDDKAVIEALSSTDLGVRQTALAEVARRHLHAAVPRLLEILHSEDPLARDGAIGALVALHEKGAVKAIADLAKFGDVDLMRRIVDAIGQIGGTEARAYLEFVAGGHEEPLIREMAKQALQRLDRREGRGGTGDGGPSVPTSP